ncbi:chitin synthase domain-containing protein [Hirsutella rhossiliensis]|uniref:chitin synthase n=1 Tax=Hirsutella rhossiliensis TaxID=111463 RepID=A0A9P8N380_9HYPO|nr:chitin synthase domain-containing protein [Hirsutella rhossiliensis]KAH0966092.1 chitin synthase domain-containing protein [Hirsutella rhossiliensis]
MAKLTKSPKTKDVPLAPSTPLETDRPLERDNQPEKDNPREHLPPPVSLGKLRSATYPGSRDSEEAKLRWNADEELERVSKGLLRLQKWSLIVGLALLNGALIYVSLRFWQVYYLSVVLLSTNTALQAFMIVCIAGHFLFTRTLRVCRRRRERRGAGARPTAPEKLVLLLPCYNETREELTRSLDSLVAQNGLDIHPRVILVVVDGNVRGPGMDKTTQAYLTEDVLERGEEKMFENGYRARDGLLMPVKTQTGRYKGVPYILMAKRYRQGKRDSLCAARSLLFHFRQRTQNAVTMFSNELFDYVCQTLVQNGVDQVDYLVGMDADTVFDEHCVAEMMRAIRRRPQLVGVCGHVCVDYAGRNFGLWSLYQSVEYSQTQGLRRMFQSRITGKVNCLPGCCQLLRVQEATFGDAVLRERFGYCPKPNDVLTKQIMGSYSEDSIHASLIFSLHPDRQTAQALGAKAFTVVPQSWRVFL